MDVLINVAHGFGIALLPVNLLYCFIGVFIGTLVGVLPGIGPISAMSLLLPVTLSGTPESGIIMMAGIYYGSMYGGSTTSILVNIPGEAASVVTCIDGHQMAKQGRAGPALGISALGSFIAGTFSLVALMLIAPSLAGVAIAFGPAEYFSLMVLGLVVLTFLTQGSMPKALLMACIGVVLGLIGLDSITAQPRLTFGRMELIDGIGLVPVLMGLFGDGAIEGVAGPESANNAAAGGAFIPLMTLGIPPNVVMALLLGAFVIHGLQPGPLLITQKPELFWGIVASMYIGNVMLLVLNLPMIGMWVQLLKLPYNILFPLIILFTIIGVYCSSNNVFDVYVMIAFGVIGYFMRKLGYEPAPLVLAFVLGPMLENNLRKSLILSQGDLMTFVARPISAACLALAVVLLVGPLLPALRKKRELVALDEGA